jgi:hypothetical protein
MEENTNWIRRKNRNEIGDKNQPAIYYIAHSTSNMEGKEFSFDKEIAYIGMSISKSGLKGRLDQFEKAMHGFDGVHGGADKVIFKYKNADIFFQNAYVSACILKLSANRSTPNDWRIKGTCVGHEYTSSAEYLDRHNELPEFNDQRKSKKK